MYDAHRFAQIFASCIEEHPLLIYASALPFTPIDTMIYNHFGTGSQLTRVTGDLDRLWSPLRMVLLHNDNIQSLAFTSDGSRIVAAALDNTIQSWDVHAGSRATTLMPSHNAAETKTLRILALSSDCMRIVSLCIHNVSSESDNETALYVLDVSSGVQPLEQIDADFNDIRTGLFSADGAFFACSAGSAIHLWDANSGKRMLSSASGVDKSDAITSLAFFPDSTHAVAGSSSGKICIWAVNQDILGPLAQAYGTVGEIYSLHILADGSQLRSLSSDGTVCIRDLAPDLSIVTAAIIDNEYLTANPGDHFSFGAFSVDGIQVVLGTYRGSIVLCNAGSGAVIHTIDNGSRPTAIAMSSDGRMIASDSGTSIRLWDISAIQSATGTSPTTSESAHGCFVSIPACSLDGTFIAFKKFVEHEGLTIRFMDISSDQKFVWHLRDQVDDILSFALSPDGRKLMFSSCSRGICVWDTVTKTTIHEIQDEYSYSITAADFSPDGKRLVCGSSDGKISIWDTIEGVRLVGPWKGHWNGPRMSVAFSPDGTQVASGACDRNEICIWDAMSGGRVVGPLNEPGGPADSVAFSHDGTKIISRSYSDGSSMQWDITSGAQIQFSDSLPRSRCPCRARDRFILDSSNWIIDSEALTYRPITRLTAMIDTVQMTVSSLTSMVLITHTKAFILHFPPNMLVA